MIKKKKVASHVHRKWQEKLEVSELASPPAPPKQLMAFNETHADLEPLSKC